MMFGTIQNSSKKFETKRIMDNFVETSLPATQICFVPKSSFYPFTSWNSTSNTLLPRHMDSFYQICKQKIWKQERGIISEIQGNLKIFEKILKLDNQKEIFDYFIANANNANNLIDIVYKIEKLKIKYFGSAAELTLSVNHDPEMNYEFLKFYIRQNSYPDDFLDRLDKLQEEYFSDMHKHNFWILVSSDFKPIKK